MNKKNNIDTVLEVLFSSPSSKFHIRELARLTNLNPNTIVSIIEQLVKEKTVKKETKKHIVEVSLNFEDRAVKWKKKVSNILRVYESGVVDFLAEHYQPTAISLIGSYSRGEDIEKSDIDLVVLSQKKDIIDLNKFEKLLGKKVHLLVLERGKMGDEFFNNLINGIVLYGAIRK